MIRVNIILTIVAILSLLVNFFLIFQNQNNFNRNFEAEYRPYVFIEEIDTRFDNGLATYDYKAINRGKTPARITSHNFEENPEKDKIISPGQTYILTKTYDNPQNLIKNHHIYYTGATVFKDKPYHYSSKVTHTYGQKPGIISSTFD